MPTPPPEPAAVVVPTTDVDATVRFLLDAGFRVDRIVPADDPSQVFLSGHDARLMVERTAEASAVRLTVPGLTDAVAGPDGLRLEPTPWFERPTAEPGAPEVVITRVDATESSAGRAGMGYQDLLPSRMGGRFIASEIHIAEDGPVSDWVHHHDVDAQVIVCVEGWVEVVYEDQGPAFVMHPGDAVLQPPHIRHRVLRAGGGLRVVEITGPAIHQTFSDHDMELPTSRLRRTRDFSGQRFHRHIAASGSWDPSAIQGFDQRSTGIGTASAGAIDVDFVRRAGDVDGSLQAAGSLTVASVRTGWVEIEHEGTSSRLNGRDAVALVDGAAVNVVDASVDAEMLLVTCR